MSELDARAERLTSHLAAAFGGRSQVGPVDLGRAVAGQINNNGLTVHGTVRQVCEAVVAAFDAGFDGEPTPVEEVVRVCEATLRELGVQPERLPYTVASSATSATWYVVVNENMLDAGARVSNNPFPLDGWERVYSAHGTREEAEASLAEAREYAAGRKLP